MINFIKKTINKLHKVPAFGYSDEEMLNNIDTQVIINYLVENGHWPQSVVPFGEGIKDLIMTVDGFEDDSRLLSKDRIQLIIRAAVGLEPVQHLSDIKYTKVNADQLVAFFDKIGLTKGRYQYEEDTPYCDKTIGDCDEYMYAAMGLANLRHGKAAFGMATTLTHAFNCFVGSDNKLYVYEPQNNTYAPATKDHGLRHIWM